MEKKLHETSHGDLVFWYSEDNSNRVLLAWQPYHQDPTRGWNGADNYTGSAFTCPGHIVPLLVLSAKVSVRGINWTAVMTGTGIGWISSNDKIRYT